MSLITNKKCTLLIGALKLLAVMFSCSLFFISAGVKADGFVNSTPKLKKENENLNALFQFARPRQECGLEASDDESEDVVGVSKYTGKINNQRIPSNKKNQCLISIKKAKKLWEKNKLTFIDIRSQVDFEKAHIPGSLNISGSLLKTKSFLKNRYVVIVAKGHAIHGQLLTCLNLRKAGYGRVSVLDGGLYSWKQTAPLVGDAEFAKLDRLSPVEFNEAQRERDWIVVDALGMGEEVANLFAGQSFIKYTGDFVGLKKDIIKNQIMDDARQKLSFLIIGDKYVTYSRLINIIKKEGSWPIYYLDSSVNDYRDYLIKQNMMLSKIAAGPKRVKRCGG